MGRATGVDFSSKAKLKALQAEGYEADEIASMISVEVKCVESWMEHFADKPKAQARESSKKAKKDKKES